MAGAQPGVHVLNLEPNVVPKSLVAGEKVFKWDEVNIIIVICKHKSDTC